MSPAFPECVPVLSDGVLTLRPSPQDDDPEARSWAVTDPNGAFHGSIDLWLDTDGRASVGFAVDPRGSAVDPRGSAVDQQVSPVELVARAGRLVCGWAFEHGTEVVHWTALAGDWGSRRVASACGFTMHGLVLGLLGSCGRGPRDGWVGTLRRGHPTTQRGHWLDAPVLEGASLRLRPWRDDDAAYLVDPDADAQRFMPHGGAPFVADFADWKLARDTRMADGEGLYWCIADRETDRPAGHLQLFRLDLAMFAGSAEVGYWLLPRERGRARMAEALALARDYAFAASGQGGLGLHRLAAGTDAENAASNSVLLRAGYSQLGREHGIMARADGSHADGLLWELLFDHRPASAVEAATIDGAAVRLRPWRSADAGRVAAACQDPHTRHWLAGLPDPYDEDSARVFIDSARAATASGSELYWAVADVGTDAMAGALTLRTAGAPDTREVGYWAHPEARGRGMMAEALRLAVRHARIDAQDGGLGLRRLVLRAAAGNVASQRVAEHAGFVQTGSNRQEQRLGDGTYTDMISYDLLCAEPAG